MTNWSDGHGGYGGPNPIGENNPAGGQFGSGPWQSGAPQQPGWGSTGQMGWQQPPVGAPQFGGLPPAGGPPTNRKAVVITVCAGVAVLVVIAIVGAVLLFSGGKANSDTAGGAVQGYLEALARGDAAGALAFGVDQPASKELLTDEILKKQIAKMPISNIRILSDDSATGFGMGNVHVSANFGDQTSDTTVSLKKDGGRWKLDSAAVRLDFSKNIEKADAALTAFGKTVGSSVVYMFPGWVDWGSSNDNVAVKGKPVLLDSLNSYSSVYELADFSLSDAGRAGIIAAVRDQLTSCAQSKMLEPDNCPQKAYEFRAVDGTVVWQAPDASSAEIDMYGSDLDANVSLNGTFTYTVQGTDGSTITGSSSAYLSGKADLTQSPPTVAWS